MLQRISIIVAVLAVGISSAQACRQCNDQKEGLYLGDFKLLGNGTVRSWVRLNAEGNPVAVGVTMSETALQGLVEKAPKNPHDEEYELELPIEAARTGIDHIALNWNPEGHIPPGIYDTPHFDFHFYLISREERDRIELGDEEQMARFAMALEERYVPEGYIFAPASEEPRMGAHWIDPASPEFNGQPFSTTYIYGAYEGKMVFLEPMVTREILASKTNMTMPIRQPEAFQKEGFYPSEWCITYDDQRKEVTVALQGLVYHEGEKK